MSKTFSLNRRTFLTSAFAGAAALAVVGCTPGKEPESNPQPEQTVQELEYTYETINTDVLVLGGGNLAVGAAQTAIAAGRTATIVDKGTFRHSGVSGLSWDYFLDNVLDGQVRGEATWRTYLNGKAMLKSIDFVEKFCGHNRFTYQVNMGQTLPDRDENGHTLPNYVPTSTQGQFLRRHMDHLMESPEFNVIDRTMITDLLISDGKCVGAMGIHLPTGMFRIIRANAVIIAAGNCTWFYGWRGVTAYSINTADNTADVPMAAFRHGAGITNSEFAQYDVVTIVPEGLTCSFGAGVCGDAQEPQTIFDKDGNLLFDLEDERIWTDRAYFCRFMGKAIAVDGRGTENGAILVSIGDSHVRYGNARNIPLLEKFGYKPREEALEAVPELFEHGGNPWVDENMMTEIPGLFCAYNFPYGSVCHNFYHGLYTGHCAAEYAANNTHNSSEIDLSGADAEYARLYEIRTKTTEDALRPHEVRLKIQAAGYKGMGPYRTKAAMEATIAEIERIRKEDLPRMTVADNSLAFNTEWKDAIENYNLLDILEMSVRASLIREESRDAYLYAEFPDVDDENWACALACYKDNDQMKFEKHFFDKVSG